MNVLQLNEEAIFHVARRIADREARVAYLEQVSGGDAALRRRVVRLLRACEQEASFLEVPACDATVDMPVPTARPGTVIGPYTRLSWKNRSSNAGMRFPERTLSAASTGWRLRRALEFSPASGC
jgi:hypothetical protein